MGTSKKRRHNKKQTPKKKTTTSTNKKTIITLPATPAKEDQSEPGPTPRRSRRLQQLKAQAQAQPTPIPTIVQPTPAPTTVQSTPVPTIVQPIPPSATPIINQGRLPRIDKFFSKFPTFQYDPYRHPSCEFQRLSQERDWDWKKKRPSGKVIVPPAALDARKEFRSALILQFNETYGTHESDLAAWQGLCRALQYDDIPNTLEECRALVMSTHVNIVDLLAYQNTGEEVHKFTTEVALSKYTIDTGKYFPREDANFGSLLRRLRRHILNPSLERGGGSLSRRRNRTRVGGRGRGRGGG